MTTRTRCPRSSLSFLAFLGVSSLCAGLALAVQPDALQRERLAQMRVPFVENCGQWDERVAFAAKTGFGAVFITRDGELVYSLPGDSGGWTLTEASPAGAAPATIARTTRIPAARWPLSSSRRSGCNCTGPDEQQSSLDQEPRQP